jgi:FlaA1/EpsC-like NDP-sugar epimerase
MTLPFSERRVLLTGAGGSIGAALAKEIVKHNPGAVLLLDHSEGNLHQIDFEMKGVSDVCQPILGDICDKALLTEIFEEYKPEFVIHAAAYKHVPLTERNALAAVRNNALGTNQLAKLASAYGINSFVMVSTDKAVHPHSMMGASKRIAELAILRWNSATSPMRAVRLGNVRGSQGSVVPTFRQQIAAGRPVTVTHQEASRYFFSLEEAVQLLLVSLTMGDGGIFVPDPGEPVKILELARQMIRDSGVERNEDFALEITELRPGDKLHEEFVATFETIEPSVAGNLRRVMTPRPLLNEFDDLLEQLNESVCERDLGGVLALVRALVPEYRPSELLQGQASEREARSQ